jgi:GMP synthase (glutamine-hydrolysing)
MQVLAFRHAPFEGLGRVADSLISRDIQFEYADLYLPDAPTPDWAKYDGLIFLGGSMSVNDDLAWLGVELDAIGRAVKAGQPVLGICLGAQLIAKALGAEVRRNPESEIGWYPISCTASAETDRLFTGLGTEYVFHWHGETFDLPPGGELLATSERCRNQAFRVGERQYGIQFHLEVTPEMIEDWSRNAENCTNFRDLAVPVEPHWHYLRMESLASVIFGRWCDMLREPTGNSPIGKGGSGV